MKFLFMMYFIMDYGVKNKKFIYLIILNFKRNITKHYIALATGAILV